MSTAEQLPHNTPSTLHKEDPTLSLQHAYQIALDGLLKERTAQGHWTGELSTSALSTATAISALSIVLQQSRLQKTSSHRTTTQAPGENSRDRRLQAMAERGCQWLARHQNEDGGFGDTNRSHSNIATTFLVLAAWQLADFNGQAGDRVARAWRYVQEQGSWVGLKKRYGKDKTFVVPIMTNCALAGLLPWQRISPLPYEAAWLPQSWYRFARMPVVSYAIPALVAMGQARFHHAPTRNPLLRILRRAAIKPTRRVLQKMQPASGGYLEAVPLTSFVLMSLASIGQADHPVSLRAIEFIEQSVLSDGSWPIDTNLATWGTSLSIQAICRDKEKSQEITPTTIRWLLSCQHRLRHPFTGADPGGWGWTNLSGAVPDADDTPAAMLALRSWIDSNDQATSMMRGEVSRSIAMGARWLLGLQNRDGGWPTFCRGWGQLPFDRSGTDLTAHALRALNAWHKELTDPGIRLEMTKEQQRKVTPEAIARAQEKALRYLQREQGKDGSWLPLWFGNQDDPAEENKIYGTSRVLLALADLNLTESDWGKRGLEFLRRNQNADGGWGGGVSVPYRPLQDLPPPLRREERTKSAGMASEIGGKTPRKPDGISEKNREEIGSSIEETAVALEALLACGGNNQDQEPIMRALHWLAAATQGGHLGTSWPIGFYFAKLWYHERLYPWIFTVGALGRAKRRGLF